MTLSGPPLKTALVLSSGGLFGAYQAGAWRYLAETSFQPDFVVGASVGALNGWAIAGGCGATDLNEMWLDEARSNVLRPVQKPGFRAGYFHHEPLKNLTSDIFSTYASSHKFGLVVVELPSLKSHLISGADVTATHLLASASIPVAMPFVSIGGKTFTDGGLLEDVPLWAAVQMGATRIIAIDAMHFESPWWYRVGVWPTRLFAPRLKSSTLPQITLIRPSRSLGNYKTALVWDRERLRAWMDLGYADARHALTNHLESAALPIAANPQLSHHRSPRPQL